MFSFGKDAVRFVGMVAAITFVLPGCAILTPRPAQKIVEPSQAIAPILTVNETGPLAEVTAFLDRTRQYQAESSQGVSALPPAFASMTTPMGEPRSSVPSMGVPVRQSFSTLNQAYSPVRTLPTQANTHVSLASQQTPQVRQELPVVQSISVRSHEPKTSTKQITNPLTSTNAPINMQPPTQTPTLETVVAQLEQIATDNPSWENEWRLRLSQLALHRDDAAASMSNSVAPHIRTLFGGLVQLAASVRTLMMNPQSDGRMALVKVDELRQLLAAQADPIVSQIALCSKVLNFGVYEEMSPEQIVAGRESQTIIYCEIENLKSQQMDDGRYRTLLGARLEILTADGRSVWKREEPEIEDLCRRPRRDFFLAQRATLPPTLPSGDYVMKVYVEDKLSGKAAEGLHPFSIQTQTALVTRP